MPFPNQDYNKRDCQLPANCKDLTDAIKHDEISALPRVQDPPITRLVSLPEKVSIKYLAEISGASLYTMSIVLDEMQVFVRVDRSVDFETAVRILRKYGIAAKRDVQ
jgi:hypothetical protein